MKKHIRVRDLPNVREVFGIEFQVPKSNPLGYSRRIVAVLVPVHLQHFIKTAGVQTLHALNFVN